MEKILGGECSQGQSEGCVRKLSLLFLHAGS